MLAAPAAGRELHVYSSLPLRGDARPSAVAIQRGIRLALREAGGAAGPFTIRYIALDDSSRAAGSWDPARTARNARRAGEDPRAIVYLGEFNSGASAIALPILNQWNVPQISPSNTYVGLTAKAPGTDRGEPGKYYPTGRQTFFRMLPDDRWQGAALANEMHGDGCARVVIADDAELYGSMLGRLTQRAARRLGLPVVRYVRYDRRDPGGVAREAAEAGADCVLVAGITGAVRELRITARDLPAARLYGADALCFDDTTQRLREHADRYECTTSELPVAAWPGGATFTAGFGDPAPDPYAIVGYEAMRLGLDTIAGLGDRGDRREAVRRSLLATRDRASVLGTYSLLASGDSTIRAFGVYRPASDGTRAFDHVVSG